jgi:hypothetical protein
MELLVSDIPYPPPFLHLFSLPHPDITRVIPELRHDPPQDPGHRETLCH